MSVIGLAKGEITAVSPRDKQMRDSQQSGFNYSQKSNIDFKRLKTNQVVQIDRADDKAKMMDGGNSQSHMPDNDQLNDDAFLDKAEEEFKRKPVIP